MSTLDMTETERVFWFKLIYKSKRNITMVREVISHQQLMFRTRAVMMDLKKKKRDFSIMLTNNSPRHSLLIILLSKKQTAKCE